VTVDEGRLASIRGNPDHPFTQGVICAKVAGYREIHEGDRILTPLLRQGEKGQADFRPISWSEALGLAAERIQQAVSEDGPESVLPYRYGGTMGVVQRKAIDRLTHRAGFSRLGDTLCSTIVEAGWQAGVGAGVGPAPQEIAESDLVVLWGIDAVSTHINLMTFVKQARRNGARLVVIDPCKTRTARKADLHMAPRPGTDGALACAMMQVLLSEGLAQRAYLQEKTDFDDAMEQHLLGRTPEWAAQITGIPAEEIYELARLYGRSDRPFIRVGFGMSRHRNGAVNVHAVSCLPALVGAWPKPGAGALLETSSAFEIDDESVRGQRLLGRPTRILDMSQLGRLLTDASLTPPIRALLVLNANPAGSCPELARVVEGLQREDLFTMVHEIVMSDTARYADLVLPATTFLEHADLYKSYGQYTLQLAQRAVAPCGEARCNHDLVNALAEQLGYTDDVFQRSVEQTIAQVLEDSEIRDVPLLEEQGWIDIAPPEAERHFLHGFPQPDRKFRFYPRWSEPSMPAKPDHWAVNSRDTPTQTYPLDFMVPPAHDVLNTTFTQTKRAERLHGKPALLLHPRDATERGIVDGDEVVVFNDRSRLTMRAAVSETVQPGLCICHSNHLARSFPEGVSLNALTSAERVAPAGGVAFHDNRVEVEKASLARA
jgi:anaerobic selenocysteine-containing dehydrogenase